MKGLHDVRMKPKLIGGFLLAGLIPLGISAWFSMQKAGEALGTEAFNRLAAVQNIKQEQIKTFFAERLGDADVLAKNPFTKMAMAEMDRANEAAKASGLKGLALLQNSDYRKVYEQYTEVFTHYMETYGYYDVFLICPKEGDVYYTVAKESDFGTELSRENTHLARMWKDAIRTRQIVLSDMEAYAPSNDAPAMFVASPVFDAGELLGVVALQISNERINAIMQERTGMGETGETYLVGSDKKMRSDSYLDPQGHNVEASFKGTVEENGVDTDASRQALSGQAGQEIIDDYNGNPVFSAFSPLDLPGGSRWAIIAEIDQAEVDIPVLALRQSVLWIGLAIGLVVAVFALWLATGIANPIANITKLAQRIAQGDLSQDATLEQGDEVGQLADAFREMNAALRSKAEVAEQIARGNLAVEMAAASEQDALGHAMVEMADCLKALNGEVGSLVEAAVVGQLDRRGDTARFEGDYAKIIDGINSTLNAVITPVNAAADVLNLVAGRDLTARVDGQFQGDHAKIKDSLNTAVQNIDQGMSQVGSATGQVTAAATQISSSSQSLAEGASQQASSLEEISSSLEEMASMTRQNADNSDQAKALSQTARTAADRGSEAMGHMTETIDKIKGSSDETAKIVKTIDEIAFQTNLLALNAAVEAARAGEAGKGFAVVAEEVRNLAQRSAEAAKTTANLIEESVNNAGEGVKVTEEVGQILDEITEGSRKVNDLVAEIAAASTEQAQGIDQVNEAVTQLDKVTQQNAANAEESASAAEELNAQASELKSLVEQFDLNNDVLPAADGSTEVSPDNRIHHLFEEEETSQQSAKAKRPKQTESATPEQLIALGADEDFAEF